MNKHKTLSERVKNYLLNCILNSNKEAYKPGSKITEKKVAKKLEVSQAPVREAIQDLKRMGFIESEPYKGNYVKEMSANKLKQVYDIRKVLETFAIKQVIKHSDIEEIKHLQSIIKKMAESAKENDYVKQTKSDCEFHSYIIKLSQNDILENIWKNIGIEYWTWIGLRFLKNNQKYDFEDQVKRHQIIYDAIKSQDEEKALSIIKEHFEESKDLLEKKEL